MHDEVYGLVYSNIILGGLDAFISLKQSVKTIPSLLGSFASTNEIEVLPWERLLDDVEGGLVELRFNILSWNC